MKISLLSMALLTGVSIFGAASSSDPSSANVITVDNYKDFANKSAFTILGVTPESTDREIIKQYFIVANRLHPDRNLDKQEAANAAFKLIGEAYGNLVQNGPRKRAEEAATFKAEKAAALDPVSAGLVNGIDSIRKTAMTGVMFNRINDLKAARELANNGNLAEALKIIDDIIKAGEAAIAMGKNQSASFFWLKKLRNGEKTPS